MTARSKNFGFWILDFGLAATIAATFHNLKSKIKNPKSLFSLCALCLLGAAATAQDDAQPSPEAIKFFETSVRPLLANKCFECHGPEKKKGHLRVDSRAALLEGGDTGPAIVPGQPDKSLLITAISYTDSELEMPPKQKLADKEIAVLKQWVQMGAPWPGGEKNTGTRRTKMEVTDKDREYWCFKPVVRPAAPKVARNDFVAQPLDAFILARLEEKKLEPNSPAGKRELVRRAYFDLLGLPPTPQQVDAFVNDSAADAYDKLLDHLLAQPQYGERWARYWLDVVRYGDTNGYERDGGKPDPWKYRDYVIKAFNADLSYDRFIIEQLAGDELPDKTPDSITATGFYRLGVWDDEPDDKRAAEFDELDDVVQATSAAFLGLTVGCARCHDHMFDPIPQKDYYQILSFFHNIKPYDNNGRHDPNSAVMSPIGTKDEVDKWLAQRQQKIDAKKAEVAALLEPSKKKIAEARLAKLPEAERVAYTTPKDQHTPEQQKLYNDVVNKLVVDDGAAREGLDDAGKKQFKKFEDELNRINDERAPFDWVLSVREHGSTPKKTNILVRGNAGTPGAEVQPGFVTVLDPKTPAMPPPVSGAPTTGRRTVLAQWLASPANPMTARVMVNRIWQHHFGRGIVATANDFGKAGLLPTHPELLDWLASEFVANGWSIKKLHKLIMTSSTYRLASKSDNKRANEVDPGNTLLWRQNLRRLQAEAIRDSMLAVSGQLNPKMYGSAIYPTLSAEVLATQSKPGSGWGKSSPQEQARRSIYVYVKRTLLLPMFEMFDYTNTAAPIADRPTTTVAPQALMLLNSDFVQDQSVAFAARLAKEAGADLNAQIDLGFKLAMQRAPTPRERDVAQKIVAQHMKALLKQSPPKTVLSAPLDGWKYFDGAWTFRPGGGYEVQAHAGAKTIWEKTELADGEVTCQMAMLSKSGDAGLVLRVNKAEPGIDALDAYNINFASNRLRLGKHLHNWKELATAPFNFELNKFYDVRVVLEGARIQIFMNNEDKPRIDFTDPAPIAKGAVGLRTFNEKMACRKLVVKSGGREFTQEFAPATTEAMDDAKARQLALEALCRVFFNTNEFVYVD